GGVTQGLQVVGAPRRVQSIDPHAEARAEAAFLRRRDGGRTSFGFHLGRDGVLKVQHRHVAGQGAGLLDRPRIRGGQVEDAARAHQTLPVTGIRAPVIARASGEARNRMTAARSAGATQGFGSASGMSARLAAVSMMEGRTALTVTEVDFSSSARASVRRWTPAFDAA